MGPVRPPAGAGVPARRPARVRRRGRAARALAAALASGRPDVDGVALGLGLAAFAATGLVVGLGHRAQERDAARIASLSLTDRLTGVHNYAFFEDALPRECRRAARYGLPLSLVLLDIDRFKAFNDRFGHDAGNRLLSAVGDAIRDNSRASDIAARFGGEEFAVIIPGPAEEALEAADRIRVAVGRVRVLVAGGEGVGTTISAGVADLPPRRRRRRHAPARARRHGAVPLQGRRARPGEPVLARAEVGRGLLRGAAPPGLSRAPLHGRIPAAARGPRTGRPRRRPAAAAASRCPGSACPTPRRRAAGPAGPTPRGSTRFR